MKKIALWLTALAIPFLLTGCGNGEDAPVVIPKPNVSLLTPDITPEYFVSEIGVVKPIQEVEIISEAAGIVDQIFAKIGDKVSPQSALVYIESDPSANAAKINLDTANKQLANARANLANAEASNQNQVDKAVVAVNNAQSTLEKRQRNLEELIDTNARTKTALELALATAKKNHENAQVTLDSALSEFDQSWSDFYENTKVTLDEIYFNASNYFQAVTELINPDNKSQIYWNEMPSALGGRSQGHKIDTANTYNQINTQFKTWEASYKTKDEINEENVSAILEEAKEMVQGVYKLVKKTRELVDNSIIGTTYTQTEIDTLQTTMTTHESGALDDVDDINGLKQSYQSLKLDESSDTATARNNLQIASNQFTDAENSLAKFQTSSVAAENDLKNQIEQDRKNLSAAQADLDTAMRSRDIQNDAKSLEIETLENQVRLAQDSYGKTRVLSPIAGVISDMAIDEGDYVNIGTHIGTVIQDKQVKIVFYVTKQIAKRLSVNTTVGCECEDNGDSAFSGVIAKISPTADPVNKKFRIEAIASNSEGILKPEMFVNVKINLSEQTFEESNIYVPLNAVIIGQNEQYVFVVEDGMAIQKNVETGDIFDKWVEVTSGLTPEDQVIIEGHRNLENNEAVELL